MTDNPDEKRLASRTWVRIAVGLVAAYLGAYYATVVPQPYHPKWGAEHHYEIMARRLPVVADLLFYPAHPDRLSASGPKCGSGPAFEPALVSNTTRPTSTFFAARGHIVQDGAFVQSPVSLPSPAVPVPIPVSRAVHNNLPIFWGILCSARGFCARGRRRFCEPPRMVRTVEQPQSISAYQKCRPSRRRETFRSHP